MKEWTYFWQSIDMRCSFGCNVKCGCCAFILVSVLCRFRIRFGISSETVSLNFPHSNSEDHCSKQFSKRFSRINRREKAQLESHSHYNFEHICLMEQRSTWNSSREISKSCETIRDSTVLENKFIQILYNELKLTQVHYSISIVKWRGNGVQNGSADILRCCQWSITLL